MNALETLPQPDSDHGILPAPAPVSNPELSPVPQPSTPNSQPAAEPSSKRHRNGKVARLPKEIRSRINQILQDGLPYLQITQKSNASATSLTQPSALPNLKPNPKPASQSPVVSPNPPSPNSTVNSTSCDVRRQLLSSS